MAVMLPYKHLKLYKLSYPQHKHVCRKAGLSIEDAERAHPWVRTGSSPQLQLDFPWARTMEGSQHFKREPIAKGSWDSPYSKQIQKQRLIFCKKGPKLQHCAERVPWQRNSMERMGKLLIPHVHRQENLDKVFKTDYTALLFAIKTVLHIMHEQSGFIIFNYTEITNGPFWWVSIYQQLST